VIINIIFLSIIIATFVIVLAVMNFSVFNNLLELHDGQDGKFTAIKI